MENKYFLVLCTSPADIAKELATLLVTKKLAACVNLAPGIESVYEWEGQVENSTETLMMIKTTREAYSALEKQLKEAHPYELPEIIAVPIDIGLPRFLDWVSANSNHPAD